MFEDGITDISRNTPVGRLMKYLNEPLRNTLSFSASKIWVCLIILSLLLISTHMHQVDIVKAEGPCGSTYIVIPGDTIESIAELCGITVEALLEVNPEITDPDNLYPGQIIRIPDIDSVVDTIITIGPTCGLPGQNLLVFGSGYPGEISVDLKLTQEGGDTFAVGSTLSNELGIIDTSIILPDSAQAGTAWVVTGEVFVSSAKFTSTSNKFQVIPEPVNPNAATTYVVQTGDTLNSIAEKFNRDFEALVQANPQISGGVQSGDLINIPPQNPGTPITKLNPICGPVETDILVDGTGYPPASTINLSMGPYLSSFQPVGTTSSSPSRTFQTRLTIPTNAQVGTAWVVVAETSGFTTTRSFSNLFTVTQPKDPAEPVLYIVKPGDTLNKIAVEFTRTVSSILTINPQILNPNQLLIGQKIIIPGQVQTIVIAPTAGPASTEVNIAGVGFSPFSPVALASTRDGVITELLGSIATDVNGFFTTSYLIPPNALSGQIWNIVALKSETIGADVVSESNDFTVTDVPTLLQPSLTIWTLNGPAGTELTVVGSTYPSLSQIYYTFGTETNPTHTSGTTWTEINGTFALDMVIPTSADPGERWVFAAEVVENPAVRSVSPIFTVTSP